jgi:predicted Zn-dependent protease
MHDAASRLAHAACCAAVAVAASGWLALAGAATRGAEGRPLAAGRRVLLIGLDGADWQAIDPLVKAGRLPAFARLRSGGRTGTLLSTPPLVSPILWTTIATGRRPEDHRILDFMVDVPGGGQAPVPSTERRVSALWNLFSDAHRRVAVVGWWATWPAEDVDGTIVSDRVAPQLVRDDTAIEERSVSPTSLAKALAPRLVHAGSLGREDLAAYVPLTAAELSAAQAALRAPGARLYRDPLAHLAAIVASTRSYSRIAEALATPQPDLLLAYLETIDSVSHLFVKDPRRGPGAIARAYEDADHLLARLAEAVSPDTWVIVVSDHGFYAADAGVREDPSDLAGPATAWHRPYGMVAACEAAWLAGTATVARPHDASTVTPLDITPTVLQAAGLPASREMPGRVVPELLPDEAVARAIARVATLERPRRAPAPVALAADPAAHERLAALGYLGASSSSLGRLNLGEVLYRKGDTGGAERELRQVVDEQPGNLSAWLWLAKAVAAQGRTRSALDVYERALALPGDPGDALVEAVELAAGARLVDEARRLLALRGERDGVAPLVARAVVAQLEGDTAGAERALREALARDAAYRPALERLHDLLLAQGRPRDALPPLRRATGSAPRCPECLALLGSALLASGDAAAAAQALAQAASLAPDAASPRLALARAQLKQGLTSEALASLERLAPSAEASTLRGAAQSARGEWPAAAREYQQALDSGPPSADLLNALAWARVKLGQRSEAVQLLTRSLALRAEQPEIRQLLADLERQGR